MNLDKINDEFLALDTDYLYHLGIDSNLELVKIFGDVQWVIFTRSNQDAQLVAHTVMQKLYAIGESNFNLTPLYKTERFYFYHIRNIIIVSTGIGMPSTSICLHEITKLLVHAGVKNASYLHIGAAAGIGEAIGNMIVNDKAVNTKFEPIFDNIECGIKRSYSSIFDDKLTKSLFAYGQRQPTLKIKIATVMTSTDYYDEQARNDGFLVSDYSREEQQHYLQQAKAQGICAMNMESLLVAGFCHELSIPATAISIILDDCLTFQPTFNVAEVKAHGLRNATSLCIDYIMESTHHAL